ncbi:amino acid adenylation domain-containing protein [Streptomyces sp. NPDC097981]|uniref:non-ribosomal peptide synthetase n=1 Tax=Streptomyces sp. NPDC097981 TaxID=3155428 RepID=UPI0033166D57
MSQLSAGQAQLLERLRSRKAEKAPVSEIARTAPGTRVPLLPAQARIWYFTKRFPQSAEYNLYNTVELDRAPERDRLTAAVRTLMERHDALRLRIVEEDGVPVQEDPGPAEPPVTWHDLRDLDPDAAGRRAAEIARESAAIPLPTDRAPLFRVLAVLLPGGRASLVLGFHHVIIDHWSVTQVMDELARLLSGRPLPPAHGVGYLDYAAERARSAADGRDERELAYWKTRLAGELPVLDLPRDRPRPAAETRTGAFVEFAADPELAGRVRAFAAREGASLFVVLLAAYSVLLSRLAAQDDVLVGSPLAGRDDETAEKIVGCFVKPVALRTDLSGTPGFRDLVRQVQQTVLDAQDHQTVPFERIVAELGITRTPGVNPVFQTIFGVQDGVRMDQGAEAAALTVVDTGSARTDLSVSVDDEGAGGGFHGLFEYATDLFDAASVEGFARLYLELLATLLADPGTPVRRLPLFSEERRREILHGLNAYETPRFPYATLAEPFEEQAARTPDATALVGEEGELTYAGLNERANRLAHHLAARGVRPGDKVAVCMDRGFTMVTALYAVAKAGAAYIPMDPELPDGRMAFMLEDTRPQLVLADDKGAAQLPPGPWEVLRLTGPDRPWEACPAVNPAVRTRGDALAFLLYTSGSTGRPKAVAYPVDGALANIFWLQRTYPFGPGDANILKTSYGFDVSTWELFWPLYYGARLVVARPGGQRDPGHLLELTEKYEVTTLFFVPTMMEVFLDAAPPGSCRSLRRVIIGGEEVKPRLRDAFHARFDADLVNCCGPTEAGTVVEGVIPRESGAPVVPLGRPCANFRIYVLGPDQEVLPVGMPGEMYIGGETGLAHGYHDRPALTADRFLPDPFGPVGARMYRTGDLCRYRPDGVIEHLGRIDRQVKIRGLRIELPEIEAVLRDHPGVRACVALAPRTFDGRIAVFVVPEPGTDPAAQELERHARHLLPAHMVPAAVVRVDRIPYNVNGKVDEAALLERLGTVAAGGSAELVAPEGETETRLAAIFRTVLGIEALSVTDGFFALGGHSLLVFKLIAACAEELGVRPTVGDVFAAPSVRELAARLGSAHSGTDETVVPLVRPQGRPIVLFVHGAGGSALPFRAVGEALGGSCDVYGVQAVDGPGPAPESIEEMAQRYVAAVDAVRGTRPLLLAGWSVGGCVALEMTRRWQRSGVDVLGTVLLDTWLPPAALADEDEQARARAAFAGMDLLAGERPADGPEPGYPRDGLAGLPEEAARIRALLERHRSAFLRYEPQPCAGPVHLLRAADPYPDPHIDLPAPLRAEDHGWRARISALTTGAVPGDHFTLVSPENAQELAKAIRAVVDASLSFDEI